MSTVTFTIATLNPVQLLAAVPDGHSITNTGSFAAYVQTNPGVSPLSGVAIPPGATVQLPSGPVYAITDNGAQTTLVISDMLTSAVAPTIPADDYWDMAYNTSGDSTIPLNHDVENYVAGACSIVLTIASDATITTQMYALFTLLDLGGQMMYVPFPIMSPQGDASVPPYHGNDMKLYSGVTTTTIPRSRYAITLQIGSNSETEILPYGFIIVPN